MAELDPIEQEFVANVTRYIAGLETMIEEGRRFVAENAKEIASVEALQASIDDLSGKTILIKAEVAGSDSFATLYEDIDRAREAMLSMGDAETAVSADSILLRSVNGDLGDSIADAGRAASRLSGIFHQVDSEVSTLKKSLEDAGAAMKQAGSDVDRQTRSLWEMKAALEEAGLSERDLANLATINGKALFSQGEEASAKEVKLRKLLEANNLVVGSEDDMSGAVANAAAETRAAAAAAAAAGNTYRIWGTGIRVTGNALHWIISGTMEILAVLIPALIAAAGSAMVMAEGATWVADRMNAVYTATEATSAIFHTTAGQAIGLSGALQQAQTAADPKVYELLGAGINALTPSVTGVKSSFQDFWQQLTPAIDAMDRFAARFVIDMHSSFGATVSGLISHMSADLVALGQVFGNLGRAIMIVAAGMPGLAEVLLGVLAGFTKLAEAALNLVSHINILGFSAITLVMGLEELGRWGGLLFRVFGSVIGIFGRLIGLFAPLVPEMGAAGAAIGGFGASMTAAGRTANGFRGAMRMLFTTPWGWALIGAAVLGVLTYEFLKTQDAAQALTSQMENQIGTSTLAGGLAKIVVDLPQLQSRINATSYEIEHWNTVAKQMGLSGQAASMQFQQLNSDLGVYQATMAHMVSQMASVLSINTKIGHSYYSLSQVIGLASAAGLNMNTAFDKNGKLTGTALQQILNLIAGYQAMGQTGGALNGDIQALNVSVLQQQTKVQQLNQAWDTFMSNLTGGTSALASLNSELLTIGNVTQTATSKIQTFSQGSQGISLSVDQIAKSLNSFSGTSAQVWSNYNTAVMQAQKVTDWLRTAAASGAITMQSTYVNAIKGVVAELLPFAARSKTAAAELSGIAFQATGTTMNYKQLKDWVGNVNTAQKNLNDTMNSATQYMSNLNAVAANLSTTMSTDVTSALAQGAVNVKGLADSTQNLTNSLRTNGVQTKIVQGDIQAWVKQMYTANVGANNTRSVIYQLASQMGLSKGAVKTLADEVYNLYLQMAKIHNVSATISVQTIYSSVGTPGIGTVVTTPGGGGTPVAYGGGSGHRVGPAKGFAAGGRIPGYGGGDRVPILAEAGEAVVPKHLVAGLAPYLGAHGVPGFPHHGGHGWLPHPVVHRSVFPSLHQGGLTPMERIIELWARELWRQDLHKYGRKGPVSLTEIEHLFGATKRGRGGLWNNPQYRLLEGDQRGDMMKYYLEDLQYWKMHGQVQAIETGEHRQIARLEHLMRLAELKHNKRLADLYKGDISGLEATDAAKLTGLSEGMEEIAARMGYGGERVKFGHYDRGGYLPEGLSLALNTTGSPEPVGHAPAGPQVMHVHLEIGGREIADAVLPYMVASTGRYGVRNSGKATGILKPT